jgi:hypothetical protein
VATRKQRRRREKEKRHDYEFVYVDSEGNEVEPDNADVAPPRKSSSSNGKASPKGSRQSGSRRREPQPPSWSRVLKRAAIFAPIFVAALLFIGGKHTKPAVAIGQALFLLVFFVPFSYFLDSIVWRSYQKRVGRGTAAKK